MTESINHTAALPDGEAVAWREALVDAEQALSLVICPSDRETHASDIGICERALEVVRRALASPPPASGDVRAALEAALVYLDNSDSPGGCNGKHPECGHCAAIAKVRRVLAGEKSR